jgi:hypothetical protein
MVKKACTEDITVNHFVYILSLYLFITYFPVLVLTLLLSHLSSKGCSNDWLSDPDLASKQGLVAGR